MDITSAAIATLISAITSTTVSLVISGNSAKKSLDDQLDALLGIAIQYPYLESDAYTQSWASTYDRNDERHLRYEHYCTLLFNYLNRVCAYYRYDKKKIEQYVAIKSWVRCHRKYWKDPTDAFSTVDEYEPKFVSLIESYF